MTTLSDQRSAANSAVGEPRPEDASAAPSEGARPTATVPLGQRLVHANLISSEDLDAALKEGSEKGIRLGEALLELGMAEEADLLPHVERHLGIPAARMCPGMMDPKAVRLIPRQLAERFAVVAMFKVRDSLSVAMAEPQDLFQIDEIERVTGLRVRPVFAFRSSIERILQRCYDEDFSVDAVTADLDEQSVELQPDAADFDLFDSALIEGSPIINLVNYFLVHAIRDGASDVHIEPEQKYSVVRFRVNGQLREILRPRKDMHAAVVSRVKVMAKMDIAEHRRPQDGRFQVAVEGRQVDFRVSTLPTVLGEKIVLRILDRQNLTFNLNELGVPDDMLAQLKRLLAKPYGLLLVTGPTGSGKTTTLYSALELIKSVHRNLVTVEDPVEYQIELVNQVAVDKGRDMTFAKALRSILRQDPDIIMIGEIRDAETAQIAIQAALTGHLVLSTLHTNDSAGAITRLLDMGIVSYKLAAALVGVVAQRLVRTICPKCRGFNYPSAELLGTIHYQGDPQQSFVRGEGCAACHDTGFQGRIGIYEVMSVERDIRAMITEGASLDALRDCHRRLGGRTLLEEGIRLAEEEKTSLDEVMRVAFFE